MPKRHNLAEKLYCMKTECMAALTLPVHHDTFRQWTEARIFADTGWYISPSWVSEEGWDGLIFCPDHEVDGEDLYASQDEDNSDG